VENGITRVTQNRQADMDEGQTTEMGSKWTMPDTLYQGVIHFSALLASMAKVTHDNLAATGRGGDDVVAGDRQNAGEALVLQEGAQRPVVAVGRVGGDPAERDPSRDRWPNDELDASLLLPIRWRLVTSLAMIGETDRARALC
jgi:hypothetical protein